MITTKSTKAEILAAYHAVCADAQVQRHTIKSLREDLCMAQQQPLLPPGRAVHTSYYDYVRACRGEAKQRGDRVCSYKTFAQWSAA